MTPPGRLRVREVGGGDARAVAALVTAAIADAPSSPLAPEELGDCEARVWDSLRRVSGGRGFLAVGTYDGALVATSRVLAKEFARSAHISTLHLLVAPDARRRGIGRGMLEWSVDRAFAPPETERVEMAVASVDVATRALIGGQRWSVERVARGGWMTADGVKDLLIYVRDR